MVIKWDGARNNREATTTPGSKEQKQKRKELAEPSEGYGRKRGHVTGTWPWVRKTDVPKPWPNGERAKAGRGEPNLSAFHLLSTSRTQPADRGQGSWVDMVH